MEVLQGFEVLVTIADAVMRSPADGSAERDHQFVRGRGIGNGEMDGEVMGAAALIQFVHQGDHDWGVRPAAHIGEGQIGFGAHGAAKMVAEVQGVDQRRGMLDLARSAAQRSLAIALHRSPEPARRTISSVNSAPRTGAMAMISGLRSSTKPRPAQGLAITAAAPNRYCGVGGIFAAFNEDFFVVTDDLAQLQHGDLVRMPDYGMPYRRA